MIFGACIAALFVVSSVHCCISFRYARYTRVDVKHAVLEPDHKMVFGGHLQKVEGPTEATEDPAQGWKDSRPR